jgi:DNA helicase II / ATP-dependent DNA helicase PcrA
MPWDDDLLVGSPAHGIAASNHRRIRVLAGPGAGKSFAMKRRIARLLEAGVDPREVLAVTFTRVAADDLHRELSSMIVPGADALRGRTVHSLCMSILMRNHVLPTLGRTPRPLNDFEEQPLLEDLGRQFGTKHERKRHVRAYEAAWARLQQDQPGHVQSPNDQAFAQALVRWLRLHEAMLIGEIIPTTYLYLRNNPGSPERSEYRHILIDEYQDLNRAEQEVLALLSDRADVCVVGDDDQSIYSFKHAHPDGVRDWSIQNQGQDHAIADCRRCPTTVVSMANSLIAHNARRQARSMTAFAANGPGTIAIRQYVDPATEADAVATKITQLVAGGVAPGDIIVLAQRATFGTPVFNRLRAAGVPAKSYFAEAPLDSHAAQRCYALLKLALNPEDRVAMRWLLGEGHDRWRTNEYIRVLDHCEQTGMSPNQVLAQIDAGAIRISHTAGLLAAYRTITAEVLALQAVGADLPAFLERWIPNPALMPLLHEAAITQAAVALDLQEFFSLLSHAINEPEVPMEVAEVRVMSLHKSKGLSSPYVFIVGCIEGLLPGAPEQGAPPAEVVAKLEEDRRLFYVGITRVKAAPATGRPGYLALTSAQTMDLGQAYGSGIVPVANRGRTAILNASRFIQELGPAAPAPVAGIPL